MVFSFMEYSSGLQRVNNLWEVRISIVRDLPETVLSRKKAITGPQKFTFPNTITRILLNDSFPVRYKHITEIDAFKP